MPLLVVARFGRALALLGLTAGLFTSSASAGNAADPAQLTFERDIVPIFKAYCWHCHGGEAALGGLDLRTFPLLLRGGKSGKGIVPGSAKESLLFRKFPDLGLHPPKGSRPTEAHLATLRAWIDAGAIAADRGGPLSEADSPPLRPEDRNRWAFKTPQRSPVPRVALGHDGGTSGARTPIDAFLLQRLQQKGLTFSPPADRPTFIRRASFDVIGLPPTLAEVDDFVRDSRPDAFDRLIERLLASPHYGERWGRHWLDAAGYVDTRGTDNDAALIEALDGIWQYRDYVVRAFNEDRPYDRFVLEQLAGDELIDWRHADHYTRRDRELLVATGFLRQAADVTWAQELNTSDIRHQVLFDTVQIVSSNLIGLTVHCAQCHTHKFDPISHADYYRMVGLFMPALNPHHWLHSKERTLADVSPSQRMAIDAANSGIDREVASLRAEIVKLRRPFEERLRTTKLAALAKSKRAALAGAGRTPARRGETQKALAAQVGRPAPVPADEVDRALDSKSRLRQFELRSKIGALAKSRRSYGMIQALWDLGEAPPAYLYRRGDFRTPGPQLEPGIIAVLDDPAHPFRLPPAGSRPGSTSTGYRTALAKWLTSDRHPLTARVYVNRVWMHHFGRGIVPTPENFGASGLPPSHPELLDWLAREFISSGWDIKHLHRLILKSAAYRQASAAVGALPAHDAGEKGTAGPNPAVVDPDNVLLWKMPLKRHESEIVRDAILATSGSLEVRMGGPPVPLKPNDDGSVEIDLKKLSVPSDASRRSVYLFSRRNYQLTELGVFDQPVVATNCTCRTSSAVVSQSLALMNGKFALEQAQTFAKRVARLAGTDQARQVETAFRLALARYPTADERQLATSLIREQADRYRAATTGTPGNMGAPGTMAAKKKLASLARRRSIEQNEPPADAALADLCQMLLNTNEFLYTQ